MLMLSMLAASGLHLMLSTRVDTNRTVFCLYEKYLYDYVLL